MAKTAKLKRRAPSIHSRAARRATSPSINVDERLKTATPPKFSTSNPFAVRDGGIRKRKTRQMTRNQKFRQQKGLERADIVKEQRELKVQKSVGKLKRSRERRKDWMDLNSKIGASNKGAFAALAELQDRSNGVRIDEESALQQPPEHEQKVSPNANANMDTFQTLAIRGSASATVAPIVDDEIE